MKAAMKPEMNKELKLALLGQLMSVMGQHALKGCMEPEESESEDEGEDKGSLKAMLIEEPEDESMMDEKTKRLKKLKALASE